MKMVRRFDQELEDRMQALEAYPKKYPTRRRVVCAAVRKLDEGIVICSARHFDARMCMQIFYLQLPYEGIWEQGFIDQWGVYMSREEALVVAEAQNQVIRKTGGLNSKELFSEDLY